MDYPHSVPNINLNAGKFTDGDPSIGLAPSLDPSAWANQVTDSILNVQAAGGIGPTEGDPTELLRGLQNIIAAALAGHGQCRLSLSAPNLKLAPANGNKLLVAGKQQSIPAGGVLLAPASVAAPVAVSTVAVAANVLTVQTGAAHGRASGDQVWVNSNNLGAVNAAATVIDATHFTVPFVHANLVATADTGSTGAVYFIYCALFSSNVAGAANNGAGAIRLQIASTAGLVTGNTLAVAGVTGTVEANGTWPVTVIDGTHVDLQGSAFVHAYVAGGTTSGLILEASPIGHVSNAVSGVEVKSTDATRTLVGLARTVAGPAFADSLTQRFVLSYFSRRNIALTGAVGIGSTSSGTFIEAVPVARIEFMSWGDEAAHIFTEGEYGNATAGGSAGMQQMLDGVLVGPITVISSPSTGSNYNIHCAALPNPAEGYHWSDLAVQNQSGTLSNMNFVQLAELRG